MKALRNWYTDGLVFATVIVGVLVALPLLAVLAFVTRFVLVAVLAVALVGGLAAYAASPRFRAWLQAFPEKQIAYKGLRLATDVGLAPIHTWARPERDAVVVGTDDLAPTVLGPVAAIELPQVGHRFRRGEPIVRMRRGARSVVLRAPVSGTVVDRNQALIERPELVNEEPFGGGWFVRLSGDGPREERAWLRRGGRASRWFQREVDRLIGTLLAGHEPVAAAADGGPLVAQLYREIDEVAWRELNETFFSGQGGGRA